MQYAKILFAFLLLFAMTFFFLKSDSKKAFPNWTVACNPSADKTTQSYDVIVIGGGFGGLAGASLLAKNGYKVLVLEKNAQIGGLCSGYTTEGFHFGYGAEDIGGLFERGSIQYLLHELELDASSFFVPNTRRLLVENTYFDIDLSKESFVNTIAQHFQEEKESIHRFFEYAHTVLLQAYDATMIQKWGIRIPPQLVEKVMSTQWIKEYASTHRELLAWESKTYQDVLDEYFHDSQLKKILSSVLVGNLGARPFKVSASTVVTNCFELFFYGGSHALRTTQHFATTLANYIQQHGGNVLVQTKVDKIIVDNAGVKGVRTGTDIFHAPVVISNVNAKTTYQELLKPQCLPRQFLEHIKSLPMGISSFVVHLGVSHTLSTYPALIQDKDNQVMITISSHNDPSLAPEGKSAVVIREPAHFEDFIGKSASDLEQYTNLRAELLLKKGTVLIPELKNSFVIEKILTPPFYEELIDIPLGSIYGFDESAVQVLPYFKSPVPGLYLSNACTGRPGVDAVIRNGVLCAHDIMQWKTN